MERDIPTHFPTLSMGKHRWQQGGMYRHCLWIRHLCRDDLLNMQTWEINFSQHLIASTLWWKECHTPPNSCLFSWLLLKNCMSDQPNYKHKWLDTVSEGNHPKPNPDKIKEWNWCKTCSGWTSRVSLTLDQVCNRLKWRHIQILYLMPKWHRVPYNSRDWHMPDTSVPFWTTVGQAMSSPTFQLLEWDVCRTISEI